MARVELLSVAPRPPGTSTQKVKKNPSFCAIIQRILLTKMRLSVTFYTESVSFELIYCNSQLCSLSEYLLLFIVLTIQSIQHGYGNRSK